MGNISPIRDVIDDYATISPIERYAIDTPDFQRLHFVLQNSCVYTTYSTNKNSRFAHSLGVANISGKIFEKAYNNTARSERSIFIRALDELYRELMAGNASVAMNVVHAIWADRVGDFFAFFNDPLSLVNYPPAADDSPEQLSEEPRHQRSAEPPFRDITRSDVDTGQGPSEALSEAFLLNTFGLAVRLCGLCHDLGHLPMSHIFEDALSSCRGDIFQRFGDNRSAAMEFVSQQKSQEHDIFGSQLQATAKALSHQLLKDLGYAPDELAVFVESMPFHERRSLRIMHEMQQATANLSNDPLAPYAAVVFKIAFYILAHSSKHLVGLTPHAGGVMALLHQIISSELDADRLDYTLRDADASAMRHHTFDLGRILNGVAIAHDAKADLTAQKTPQSWTLVFSYKSMSAIEFFFHTRSLNYRYIIYHHSVVRMNAIMEEILQRLIWFTYVKPNSPVSRVLDEFSFATFSEGGNGRLAESLLPNKERYRMDDAWLRTLLFRVLVAVKGSRERLDRQLTLLLETFLFRRKQNMLTHLKHEFEHAVSSTNIDGELFPSDPYANERIDDGIWSAAVNKAKRELYESGSDLILLVSRTPDKNYNPRVNPIWILGRAGVLHEVSTVSSFLRAEATAGASSKGMSIAFVGDNVRNDKESKVQCARIADALLSDLASKSAQYQTVSGDSNVQR